jgi:hypothetical protein
MTRHVYAYSFTSPLSLSQMLAKWNELGPWRWTERDNDQFGEYISTRVLDLPQRGMLKVFVESDRYAINVMLQSENPNADNKFADIRTTIFERLLPAVEASAISEAETYE